MYRALNIPPQLWVSDGVSNREGLLTNLVYEVELSPGIWEVSATQGYQMQVNTSSGQGIGTHPQTWLGQADTGTVQIDPQWTIITVPVGTVRYLNIRKIPGGSDGNWFLNRDSGPA